MKIRKMTVMNFTEEEEKALELVYDMFNNACEVRDEEKKCYSCPFHNNCPLTDGNRVQAMKNLIRKIAE